VWKERIYREILRVKKKMKKIHSFCLSEILHRNLETYHRKGYTHSHTERFFSLEGVEPCDY